MSHFLHLHFSILLNALLFSRCVLLSVSHLSGKAVPNSQQGLPTSTCPLECLGWDLALHKPLLLTLLKVNYIIQTLLYMHFQAVLLVTTEHLHLQCG